MCKWVQFFGRESLPICVNGACLEGPGGLAIPQPLAHCGTQCPTVGSGAGTGLGLVAALPALLKIWNRYSALLWCPGVLTATTRVTMLPLEL